MNYNPLTRVYTSIQDVLSDGFPPDNCPVCALIAQQAHESSTTYLKNGAIRHQGNTYHKFDFVMIKGGDGPCNIGQIKYTMDGSRRTSCSMVVRLLGRINDISGDILPEHVVRDEVC